MRRQRGVTLLEVLVSLSLVVIGLLALFGSLKAATQGSSMASRQTQAQARAQFILEAIRRAPANTINCLVGNTATNWGQCETVLTSSCVSQQQPDLGPGSPAPGSCVFTLAAMSNVPAPGRTSGTVTIPADQTVDRSGQQYQLVVQPTTFTDSADRNTRILRTGLGNRVVDVQVTIGWSDDGTAGTAGNPDHMVTLRTGFFQ